MAFELLELMSQIPWLSKNPRIRRWEILGLSICLPFLAVGLLIFAISVVSSA
jgi:hypothetical protein